MAGFRGTYAGDLHGLRAVSLTPQQLSDIPLESLLAELSLRVGVVRHTALWKDATRFVYQLAGLEAERLKARAEKGGSWGLGKTD